MRVVVTGGTGFIGRALCEALEREGHQLVVLTRGVPPVRVGCNPERAHGLWPWRESKGRLPVDGGGSRRFVVWTPLASGAWGGELDGADGIVHLAGESIAAKRWTAAQKSRLVDSRIHTTAALVEAIRHAPRTPRVLISASAVGYYGPRGDEWLTEASAPGTDFLATLCQQWETEAMAAEGLGVRVVRMRFGLVLGPDGGVLARMAPPFRWGLGGPLGHGRQWLSWIHRDDLVAMIRWALATPQVSGAINATAPQPVTMNEFAKTLGAVVHRPALFRVPGIVLRLVLGDMAEMLLTGQRVLPDAAQRLGFRFRYPELSTALAAALACTSR